MSPWQNLSPEEFEEFCFHLLGFNGFKNLSWYGKGGSDKGRDILASKIERPLQGVELAKRWVIQCKHYKKAVITKSRIADWLAACREHKPDRVLLILSGMLTSNMKDWLRNIRADYSFDIHIWEETDLKKQYLTHGGKLRKIFPQLPRLPRPVSMNAVNMAEYFIACEGFDEVEIHVYNADSKEEAMSRAKEFVEFIKANEFRIDGVK